MSFDVVRRAPLLTAVLLLFGMAAGATSSVEPANSSWVAETPSPAPDTVRSSVAAGTPLIRTLPAEVNGTPVARYTLLRGPALSGVAGRSLTWITRGVSPDTYDVRLRATRPDAAPDTLVVRVEVQSSP
jgi:hypothetical protein